MEYNFSENTSMKYNFSALDVGHEFRFYNMKFTKLTEDSAYNHNEHETQFFVDNTKVELITLQ